MVQKWVAPTACTAGEGEVISRPYATACERDIALPPHGVFCTVGSSGRQGPEPELSGVSGADRFLAEIETAANLQHPHILPLFDSGAVNGTGAYGTRPVESHPHARRHRRPHVACR
jgi:hypothetical protein